MDIEKILKELTLKEKAEFVAGRDFWTTKPIERLNIPSICLTDGPHGLRKQTNSNQDLNVTESVPATAFPSASTTSCSFDKELLYKMGKTIGEECVKEDVSVILGPGLNIKRSPLCGRNFEYFSEDPLLSGKMAAAFVNGVQSNNVGACLKHYCANNQETARQVSDSVVDERALHEVYLKGFEIAIKDSNPYTMMCSYNKINGTYACENEYTLKTVLRETYNYDGLIMTDWGAMDDRAASLKATLDLEMPSSGKDNAKKIIKAIKKKKLDIKYLDEAVRHLLELIDKTKNPTKPCDMEEHHKICEEIADGSITLLKNDDSFFPLDKNESSVAMIGDLFKKIRFLGGGSSQLTPYKITNVDEALDNRNIKYIFSKGYDLKGEDDAEKLINEAIEVAKKASKVVLFIGLTDKEESEGYDRTHLNLSDLHNRLVEETLKVNPNVGIVLFNGSVVALPWKDKVKGILEVGLPGAAGGNAIANVLYGDVNPSGRLSETYIDDLAFNPSFLNFADRKIVLYKESIYVGYRYFNSYPEKIIYPFGYGLSYTKFDYSNFKVDKSKIDEKILKLSVDVTNIGKVKGKEVAQIYFKAPSSGNGRPERELIDFDKVELEPKETKTLEFIIDINDLKYFNIETRSFEFENGNYSIIVGKDALTTIFEEKFDLNYEDAINLPEFYRDYLKIEDGKLVIDNSRFKDMLTKDVPAIDPTKKEKFNISSSFSEIRRKWFGRFLYNTIIKQVTKLLGSVFAEELIPVFEDMPIRCLSMFTLGKLGYIRIEGIADILNNHYLRGFRKLIFG